MAHTKTAVASWEHQAVGCCGPSNDETGILKRLRYISYMLSNVMSGYRPQVGCKVRLQNLMGQIGRMLGCVEDPAAKASESY